MSVGLSVCLSAAACPHYYTDPDVTWGSGRGCPLVAHYSADLQSVHGLRCYGNITRTRNVSEYMLVLAICPVFILTTLYSLLGNITSKSAVDCSCGDSEASRYNHEQQLAVAHHCTLRSMRSPLL